MIHIPIQQNIPHSVSLVAITFRHNPVGVFGINSPAVFLQGVTFYHPMIGSPLLALARQIANQRDACAVISLATIAAQQGVGGGTEHEHNPRMAIVGQMRRIVLA